MEAKHDTILGLPGSKVPNVTLGQYIYRRLQDHGDNIIQVDVETNKHYTCREILEKSVVLANILKSYGIQVDDRVGIASENHPNYMVVACAAFFTGAAWAPLNPAYTEREYRHMLDIYQPRIMFVTQRTEKILSQIAPTLNWSMKLIQVDDKPLDGQMITLNELLDKHKNTVNLNTFKPVSVDDNSKRMAAILGSSGTTGFPKGVTLSHRNLLTFLSHIRSPTYIDSRSGDRILLFLPLFHGYAFAMMCMAISTGAIIYLIQKFEPVSFFKAIDDYKITHLPIVPPVMTILAKHQMVPKYDFTSVREVLCGAAPLQLKMWREVQRRTKMRYVRNGYGMTELSVISNLSDRDSTDDNVGAAISGFQCKIVDTETGKSLGPRGVGEVCFRGDQVMLGYFRNPKVTAETIDADNWLHTGDLGFLDEKNVLHITGRIKELIKYKGYQVAPSELEAVMLSHPSVKDVAVLGKPDEISGEIPIAFVVKQPGTNPSAKEIVEFANKNLSPQKWIRGGVIFVADIPKTPSGKILRRNMMGLIPKL